MTTDTQLAPLFKKTSTGAIQTWEIKVEGFYHGHHDHMETDPARIITTYGQLGGKMQTAVDEITEGKNIGKVNETTPFQQAQAEALSQWEKKQKRQYVQNLEDAEEGKVDSAFIAGGVAPMLAQDFAKHGAKIVYPAYIQPKLDGHRCISMIHDGVCTLWSRTQKRITGVPHIERALERMFPEVNITLDGELYNHDYKDKFEQLTSFIRQETPKPGHEVVQYHVYDVVTDGTFETRKGLLDLVGQLTIPNFADRAIVEVMTVPVDSEDEMTEFSEAFLGMGYEGAIARNAGGLYKNKRSYDLQKIKTFEDAEFEVVAIEEGRGKMAGKAMFVCKTGNETFRVKMVGNIDALAEYLIEPDKWIGQMLTVKFFGVTNAAGVPRFPVALRFREDV